MKNEITPAVDSTEVTVKSGISERLDTYFDELDKILKIDVNTAEKHLVAAKVKVLGYLTTLAAKQVEASNPNNGGTYIQINAGDADANDILEDI